MQIEHFFSPNSGENQKKKRSWARVEHFFPQIYAQLYTHSNYWGGGDADVDHSQTIGGIYPPIPPDFGTPVPKRVGSAYPQNLQGRLGSASGLQTMRYSSFLMNLRRILTKICRKRYRVLLKKNFFLVFA